MPTNLDDVITKLSDKGVQSRLRTAMQQATLDALKKEGVELSPAEWGELTARMIAANQGGIRPNVDWGSILNQTLPPILGALSDRRLETNIVHRETRADGLSIYEFSYTGFTNRWRGVIAQNVVETYPEAVVENKDGYLTVDYNRLNVLLQPAWV
jgi:hypothetical protein